MNFARVEMLFLFWGVPLLLLAYLYGWRKRRLILERFAHRRTLSGLVPPGIDGRRRLRAILVLAAALLLVLALAGPQYGYQWQTVTRHGVDLIIALDCSRSMLAQDIQPTRLARAKREIVDLLAMLQGDRVG
ncbi:MAG: BatA domain-containing protein, partial [Desulfobacterales bacterium]|nr:BatA domain-containing protein [Desulfobacterales bacterium]